MGAKTALPRTTIFITFSVAHVCAHAFTLVHWYLIITFFPSVMIGYREFFLTYSSSMSSANNFSQTYLFI